MALGLPVNLRSLLGLVGDVEAEAARPLRLELLVDKSVSAPFREYARQAFEPLGPNLELVLAAYGSGGLANGGASGGGGLASGGAASGGGGDAAGGDAAGGGDAASGDAAGGGRTGLAKAPALAEAADLTIILAGSSSYTAVLMLSAALHHRSVVVVTEDVAQLAEAWPTQVIDIDASRLVALEPGQLARTGYAPLFANLARWMLNDQSANQLAWARTLGFVRQAFATDLVGSTALTNGVVALAVFLPGADLPVLLFNQMRMYIKLAAVWGLPADSRRYAELAALLLAGLGWRGLARRLVSGMPAFGWAVKATVGYCGTLCLGLAAQVYLPVAAQALVLPAADPDSKVTPKDQLAPGSLPVPDPSSLEAPDSKDLP